MTDRGAPTPALMHYAAVGSRASGFHHDVASKLQSLMMALDELAELTSDASAEVRLAAETAQTALREMHQLFTFNRALAKPPQRKPTPLRELVERAAARHAVRLRGALPAVFVNVAPPSITHAIAIVVDLSAGSPQRDRALDVAVTQTPTHVEVTLHGTPVTPPNAGELVQIATFLVEREEGRLVATPTGFTVALPLV